MPLLSKKRVSSSMLLDRRWASSYALYIYMRSEHKKAI